MAVRGPRRAARLQQPLGRVRRGRATAAVEELPARVLPAGGGASQSGSGAGPEAARGAGDEAAARGGAGRVEGLHRSHQRKPRAAPGIRGRAQCGGSGAGEGGGGEAVPRLRQVGSGRGLLQAPRSPAREPSRRGSEAAERVRRVAASDRREDPPLRRGDRGPQGRYRGSAEVHPAPRRRPGEDRGHREAHPRDRQAAGGLQRPGQAAADGTVLDRGSQELLGSADGRSLSELPRRHQQGRVLGTMGGPGGEEGESAGGGHEGAVRRRSRDGGRVPEDPRGRL